MNCENGRYTGVKRRFQERKVYGKVPCRCNRGHKWRKEKEWDNPMQEHGKERTRTAFCCRVPLETDYRHSHIVIQVCIADGCRFSWLRPHSGRRPPIRR